jgi:hypothetical protein
MEGVDARPEKTVFFRDDITRNCCPEIETVLLLPAQRVFALNYCAPIFMVAPFIKTAPFIAPLFFS